LYHNILITNDLLQDTKLILFNEALIYCESNNAEYIKYATFRKLCNERLAHLTNGARTELGGSFESMIKRLTDTSIPGEKRFFTRIRSEYTKKDSRIYPNIDLIKAELQRRKLISHLADSNRKISVLDTKVSVSKPLRENVKVTEMLGTKVTRVKSRDFLKKDVGPGLSSSLESNLVDVITSTPGNNSGLNINKETKKQLSDLVQQIIAQNKVPLSFMVILRYNGIPSSLDELIKSERFYDFYQKLNDYFVEWAEHFEMYEIGQEDKNSLYDCKIEDLSEDGQDKLKEFIQDLIGNTPKDNIVTPILSGFYRKISNDDSD